jgi:hypothetical protein
VFAIEAAAGREGAFVAIKREIRLLRFEAADKGHV